MGRHDYGQPVKEGGQGELDRAIPLARLAAAVEPLDGLRTVCTLLFMRGAPGDNEEAAWWLREPAVWIPEAAAQLGYRLSEGNGIHRDTKASIAFWYLGAEVNAGAAARAGESLVYGLCAPVDEEIGIEMLRSSFRTGNRDAANILGTCYDEGAGVPQSGRRAWRFFAIAAKKGLSMAALNLGILLFDGRRVDPNPVEAVKWLEQAAAAGWGQALHLLAVMVYRGEGTPRNVERALDLFTRAQAENHLLSILTTLEDEVLRVRPVAVRQRDFAGKIRRAEEAAGNGDADAAFQASLAHWNGETAQVLSSEGFTWSRSPDLNWGSTDYETASRC
jgi:TPR repeat protein